MLRKELTSSTFKNVDKPYQPHNLYRCPCCRFKTLHARGQFEMCPVCFWEDEGQDDHDADEVRGGPNGSLSLTRARANFLKHKRSGDRPPKHAREYTYTVSLRVESASLDATKVTRELAN